MKLIYYAVNYVSNVWLNGNYIGYHEGGYTSFAFDVSNYINLGGNNLLVVCVDNPEWGNINDIVPYTQCDWFNYTVIIHDVYLEFSNPVNVIRANVVPLNLQGDIQTTVVLYNKSNSLKNIDVSIEIFNAEINSQNSTLERASDLIGTPTAFSGMPPTSISIMSDSTWVWRINLTIQNPRLWSSKTPNLYVMKIILKENGKIVDVCYTQFGVRTIRSNIDKVYLNDKPVFFVGVVIHEDQPLYGRSHPP